MGMGIMLRYVNNGIELSQSGATADFAGFAGSAFGKVDSAPGGGARAMPALPTASRDLRAKLPLSLARTFGMITLHPSFQVSLVLFFCFRQFSLFPFHLSYPFRRRLHLPRPFAC